MTLCAKISNNCRKNSDNCERKIYNCGEKVHNCGKKVRNCDKKMDNCGIILKVFDSKNKKNREIIMKKHEKDSIISCRFVSFRGYIYLIQTRTFKI
jgi:hypothetical protein